MSFIRYFISIFVSPNKVFDDIRDAKVSWWQPWLMISVVVMIATWLMLPVQKAVMDATPELQQTEQAASMIKVMQLVQVFIAPVLVLIVSVIVTGISYVVVTLVSKEATFKKYLTLVLFADVVASIGFLATIIIVRARGLDQVMSPEDLKVGLSLRPLAPDAGAVVSGLLGSIEFFAVWGFALIVLGLRRILGIGMGAAIACSIPLWLLYTVFTVVGEVMNQARQ